ncbi:MAG: hypothetical protein KL839_13010 [Rhizobium sp.]|nr:hypothetical protein [Rhizobium sp.]
MTQSPNNLTKDLLSRLGDALAGTHGRELSLDAVKSLVDLEVQDWNLDRCPDDSRSGTARVEQPLIGHRIRLSSD